MINNRQQGRRRRGRGPQGNGGSRNEGGSRIDNRARGNAPQMLEKYKNMARDAQLQGDRVMTEYYLQFADHYFRIVAEQRARFEEQRRQRDDWQDDGEEGEGDEQLADGGESDLDAEADGNRRDRSERHDRNERSDRNDRNDRNDRYERNNGRRDARDDDARRPSRPRPRAEDRDLDADVPATLDISVLPPAFASDGPPVLIDLDEPELVADVAPRKRGRPRRAASEAGEAAE